MPSLFSAIQQRSSAVIQESNRASMEEPPGPPPPQREEDRNGINPSLQGLSSNQDADAPWTIINWAGAVTATERQEASSSSAGGPGVVQDGMVNKGTITCPVCDGWNIDAPSGCNCGNV